jgi:TrmH family RNA methyltransferase
MLSRTHPVARRLRALKGDPALREKEGVFVAEGIHLALEALRANAAIEAAVVSPRLSESDEGRELVHRLRTAVVALHETSDATLDGLQDARAPQPVVLIVRREPVSLETALTGRGGPALLVVACGVQEPGNLGALLRTADAAGATGFVATPGSASLTHPRAVRASMGAIFRLPAAEARLDDVLEKVESRRFRVMGALARGAVSYDEVSWEEPTVLLLGGEGAGLPEEAVARLDLRVAIPMAAGVESLSVNAAAAVVLFEAARQRRLRISRA